MRLCISTRPLNGNPLVILLISLFLVVSSCGDAPSARLTDLLVPSPEEIEDLSCPRGTPGRADPCCDGGDLTGAPLASVRHAEATAVLSEDRFPFLPAPVHASRRAYRAPPRLC